MPLPIPQQVLAQPVTSYYKGKAIRQELATAKKEEELLDLQIDAARNPKADPKEARDASLFLRDAVAEAGAAAVLQAREGASPEDVTAAFDGTLVKSGLPEEALAEIKKGYDRNGDGLLGEAELAELEAFSIARGQELQGGDANAQQTEFIGDDGQAHVGTYNPNTETYTDAAGTEHKNAKPIAGGATQAELTGAGTDKVIGRQVREVMGSTDNLLDSLERIDSLVATAPQASLGLPGGVSGMIDNTISAVNGFAEIAGGWAEIEGNPGVEVRSEALLDTRLYEDYFAGYSERNAAIEANAVGVAYALARAANPDGRISDADVRHQLERLKLNQSSKTRIHASIKEVKRSQLGSAMNWLRTSGATRTADGKAAFAKYETMLNAMDAAESPQKEPPPDYDGPIMDGPNGEVYILNKDGTDWVLVQ